MLLLSSFPNKSIFLTEVNLEGEEIRVIGTVIGDLRHT